MKLSYALLALPVLVANANPAKYEDDPSTPSSGTANDNDFLNYALQLGRAQEALYNQGLSQFSDSDFNATYGPGIRNGFVQISQNKQAQNALLNQTLGANATGPCTYNFTFSSISAFTNLSQVLEDVGTAAYIGAAPNITNGTSATTAASILSNNARSASWVSSAVNGVEPWDGAFDTPQTPEQVQTLLAPYTTSCPPGTGTAFPPAPSLTVSPAAAGENATYTFSNSTSSSTGTPLFAVFFQGLNQTFVPLNNDTATVPNNLTGIVYTAVTNSSSVANDNTTVAGPTYLNLSHHFNTTSNSTGGEGGGGGSTTTTRAPTTVTTFITPTPTSSS